MTPTELPTDGDTATPTAPPSLSPTVSPTETPSRATRPPTNLPSSSRQKAHETVYLKMAGQVEDYGPSKLSQVRSELAAALKLLTSSVSMEVQAGSVLLAATIPSMLVGKLDELVSSG